MNANRGFTLLELIVVIAIFAVFSLLAYGGLDSVLRTRQQVEQSQERLAELQKAYQRLRDDLQQVAARPIRNGYGDTEAALVGYESPLTLEFTRGGWRNPVQQPRSTLERVNYRLDEQKLLRNSFRVLDRAQDSKATELVLLTGVETWSLRYLDAGDEWRPRWPESSAPLQAGGPLPPPPRAVEITLRTKDLGELRWLFPIGLDTVTIPASPGGGTTGTTTSGSGETDPPPADPTDRGGDGNDPDTGGDG